MKKLGLMALVCLSFTIISVCSVTVNGEISQEWVDKIQNLQKASQDNDVLLRYFNQEVKFSKEHGYPIHPLPKGIDEVGYRRYLDTLCQYVSQIPDLDDDTAKYLLMFSDYYKPYKLVLQQKNRFWPLFKIWANDSDVVLRQEAIRIFHFISAPPVDSDMDPIIFQEANASLSKKERNEVKEILLKASHDSYAGIRNIAVYGLLPYAKDAAVVSRLRQLAKKDPKEYVRDPAQEILDLGRIRGEVERARLKRGQ